MSKRRAHPPRQSQQERLMQDFLLIGNGDLLKLEMVLIF